MGLKLSLLRGDVQSDEKQTLEAKIAELTGDVEGKKKSAAALSSILKEAEVGAVAAAAGVPVVRHSTRPDLSTGRRKSGV